MNAGLMRRETVEEVVARRDRALELHAEAYRALVEAHRARDAAWAEVQQACAGTGEGFRSYVDRHRPEIEAFEAALGDLPDEHQHAEAARRLVDTRIWASIVERTGLEALMDRQAKDELRQQMGGPREQSRWRSAVARGDEDSTDLPHVTVETVRATLEKFRQESGHVFRRGLANAFTQLDRRFRSHDGFAIGSRIIFERAFDEFGSWSYYRSSRDTLQDVERVFLVLDGKEAAAPYGGIVGKIDEDRRKSRSQFGRRQTEHEGDYFRVRVFKNGNMHLWFTRSDLVEEANKLLAEHYGAGLGWGRMQSEDPEAPLGQRAVGHAKNLGFFPTPPAVVACLMEQAHWDGMAVLEPSAGTGVLAFEAVERGAAVDAVELDPQRFEALSRAGAGLRSVRPGDFLELAPEPRYDRVLMNPPFDRGRDVDHVWHAWHFLKPGGRLVAVMSAGTEFRSDRKTAAFRKAMGDAGARWLDLPAGSFAPATNVQTLVLVADRPRG